MESKQLMDILKIKNYCKMLTNIGKKLKIKKTINFNEINVIILLIHINFINSFLLFKGNIH